MDLQPAEHIVLRSQPLYPALTESESLAVQQIRLRALSCKRPPPCSPLPGRVGPAWLSTLLTLMALRGLLAVFA